MKLYGKGAELRETKSPENISGPVAQADAGEVVISRIDCTQGAVAIIPEELNDGVVSKEFFLIKVDESKLLTPLFTRILLHKRYVQFLLSFRTGATNRLRLDKDVLLELPLPQIKSNHQETILNEIQEAEAILSRVKSIEEAAHQMADEIVEVALTNVLDLGKDTFLSYLSDMAKIKKQDLSNEAKEALQ